MTIEKLSDIEITEERLKEMQKWNDEDYCLEAVKHNGDALRYIKEPSEEVCLEAVKHNGDALQYIKEPSEEVCLEAVQEDGDALQYIKEPHLSNLTIIKSEQKKTCECCGQSVV